MSDSPLRSRQGDAVDPTEVARLQGAIVGSIYEREIKRLEDALRLIVAGRQLGLLDFKDHALSIALEALREANPNAS